MSRTLVSKKISLTVSNAGTPVQISSTRLLVADFEFYVKSGNTGANMYIAGEPDVDNTYIPRAKGTNMNFTSGEGDLEKNEAIDLSKWYVDSDSNGDEAVIQYLAYEE